ncbi:hypothetical protein [Clostridium scatologenes]|uniref:Uncharacterized protein n=1 Tax=Clostridium scatologenes TaxID=1548 RepID=A0A0E3GSC4_CLOSL|nr:hypothetical protein [Clostridium scatologenes]AKA71826.1 hypothetical protein CSCA_4701 [Clostridium scatologenes]
MIHKNLPYIIKNSENIIYKFNLDSSHNLIVESYNDLDTSANVNNRFTYKQYVLDYSVDMDDKDKIHIAFITEDGLLKYSTLDFPNIEKTISSVYSKDYKINYVTIKIISSDIHIFYMIQSKYNVDKWSIHHSFFHNNLWVSKKLTEISFIKNSLPYNIDFYKNNIYIFHSTNISYQYCIQKFSISFSLWSTIENNINLMNCQNAEFFINETGIGIICYNSYINRSINTLLKFKDFNVNSSAWSDDLLAKTNNFDSSLPSILYNNDAIFLFWKENNTLFLGKSFYKTASLIEIKSILLKSIIISCKYIAKETSYHAYKNNFLFFISINPLNSIFEDNNVKDFLKVDIIRIDQKFNPLNGPLKETLKIIAKNSGLINKTIYNDNGDFENEKLENEEKIDTSKDESKECMDSQNNKIDYLQDTLNSKNAEIEQLKNTIDLREDEIEKFKNIITSNENEIEQLKNSFNLKQNELNQSNTNLNLKNTEIEHLKNNLKSSEVEIESLNSSYSSLKNLASEKDLLIQNLYSQIQELENRNIEDLQISKKKSFIDLFKKDH